MSTATSDLAMSVAVIGKILAPHGGSSAAYRQLVADVDRVVQELLTAEAALARTRAGLRLFSNYGGAHHMWCGVRKQPRQDCTCGLHELQVEFRDTMTEDEARAILLSTRAGADAGEGRD